MQFAMKFCHFNNLVKQIIVINWVLIICFFCYFSCFYFKQSLFCEPNVPKEQSAKIADVQLYSIQCTRSFQIFVSKLWITKCERLRTKRA